MMLGERPAGDRRWGPILASGLAAVLAGRAMAQISTDGSMGAPGYLLGPDYSIGESLGTRVGDNLFHSFSVFNVESGESATFTGSQELRNVISRVTGGTVSNIDGLLRSQVGQANFFLINPAGVVFGPNAQVDVPAAFHVSTADELRFLDGGVFSASDPSRTTLSIENPESFGFLAPQPASISINGSFLSLPDEQPASFTAGDVSIGSGALLVSRGGDLMVSAVGSGGERVAAADGVIAGRALGRISVSGGAALDVRSLTRPSNLALRAGAIDLESAVIQGDLLGSDPRSAAVLLEASDIAITDSMIGIDGYGDARPSELRISGDQVQITRSAVDSRQVGTASAGLVSITGSVSLSIEESAIDVSSYGVGPGQALDLSGTSVNLLGSAITADHYGPGVSGSVEINAGILNLTGSTYEAAVHSTGRGSDLAISALGTVIGPNAELSSRVAPSASGNGGDITVLTNQLLLQDGSRIQVFANGSGGRGGDLDIRSQVENVLLPGQASGVPLPGAVVLTRFGAGPSPVIGTSGDGDAVSGNVRIEAETYFQADSGAQIRSTVSGASLGGDVEILSGDLLSLTDAFVSSSAEDGVRGGTLMLSAKGALYAEDTTLVATSSGTADSGHVALVADAGLILLDSAVGSAVDGTGRAGQVSLQSAGDLVLGETRLTVSSSEGTVSDTGIAVNVGGDFLMQSRSALRVAGSGDVHISAQGMDVRDSEISTVTIANGRKAADIRMFATAGVGIEDALIGTDVIGTADSGGIRVEAGGLDIIANVGSASRLQSTVEQGNGGPIEVLSSGRLRLGGDAGIGTAVSGPGIGGSVHVSADTITIGDEGTGEAGRIFSSTRGDGGGGSIAIDVDSSLELADGATIQSITEGSGQAGALSIDSAGRIDLARGGIIASRAVAGGGDSGIVKITTDAMTATGEGVQATGVWATAAGTAGTNLIQISAVERLVLTGGALVVNSSFGRGGNAGIDLSAGSLLIDDQGRQDVSTGIATTVVDGAGGAVGGLRVRVAEQMVIRDGGTIAGGTSGSRDANSIVVRAGSLLIDGSAEARGDVLQPTGILSRALSGAGDASDVRVSVTGAIELVNGGEVSTVTRGNGDSGSIELRAGALRVSGLGDIASAISSVAELGSSGSGGALSVEVDGLIEMEGGASISSGTFGAGDAGEIDLRAGALYASGAGASVPTEIASNSSPDARGAAGNVSVRIQGDAVLRDGFGISAGTAGAGDGGSVLLQARTLLMENTIVTDRLTAISSRSAVGAVGDAGETRVVVEDLLQLGDGALIDSATGGSGDGGMVFVEAGEMRARAGASGVSRVTAGAEPGSSGDAGDVSVLARSRLSLANGADIVSPAFGAGDGGQVFVQAPDVIIDGEGRSRFTGVSTQAAFDAGDAGDVMVVAENLLHLRGGGVIGAETASIGAGGNLDIRAGRLLIDGPSSGISTLAAAGWSGDAGGIDVTVGSVMRLSAGARVTAETRSSGDGGSIAISAEVLQLDSGASLTSTASPEATGVAGSISVDVGELSMVESSSISTESNQERLAQDSRSTTSTPRISIGGQRIWIASSSLVSSRTIGPADSGSITVGAVAVDLRDGSAIRSDTTGAGRAGDVTVSVFGALSMDAGEILAGTSGAGQGGRVSIDASRILGTRGASITSEARGGTGDAGDVRIRAGDALVLDGGSELSTATQTRGRGGEMAVVSGGLLTLSDRASIRTGAGNLATGSPGNIRIDAREVLLDAYATVSATSEGLSPAGRIAITADRVGLTKLSTITTESERSDGGQIFIAAGERLMLRDSRIATSVLGESGDGGNIDIVAGTLDLSSGYIQANTAAPGGAGGEIGVQADRVLTNGGPLIVGGDVALPFLAGSGVSAIQAAAPDGVEGIVRTSFVGTEVAEAQTPLSAPLADAQSLLASGCLPQGRTGPSSLIALGAPGLAGNGSQRARVVLTGSRLDRLLAEASTKNVMTLAQSFADDAAPLASDLVPEPDGVPMRGLIRNVRAKASDPIVRPQGNAAGSTVFKLQTVRIEGGARLPTAGFEALYGPRLDSLVSLSDLEALRYAMTKELVEQGFVSSGVVLKPHQVIGDQGEVVFQVIEGRLSEVRVSDAGGFSPEYIRARVTPDSSRPLNRGDIEQRFRLLLEDPLIDRIDGRLLPGPVAGSTVLDVRVTRAKPWSLFVRTNNFRPPSTGAQRVYVGGVLRNPTGYGESVDLYFGRALDGDGGEGGVDISIPVTAADTRLFARYSRTNASLLQEPLRPLDIKSSTWRMDLGLSHPVLRQPGRRLVLGGQFTRAENETTLLGELFSLSDGAEKGKSTVSAARVFADYLESRESWALALRSVASFGVDWWNPTLHDDERPDSDFFAWLGQGQYVQRLNQEGRQLLLRAGAQVTPDKLLPLERFAVGGVYSVRGYRENALVGDNGYHASAALRQPVWRGNVIGGAPASLDLSVFTDVGGAWVNGQQSDAPTLWSVGVGGHFSVGEHLRAELYLAHGLRDAPDYPDYDLQDSGVQFQLELAY